MAALTLKSALTDFFSSDLGKIYFGDVDSKKTAIDTTKPDPDLPGWIVRWTHKKDIGAGPNPKPNAKALTMPTATSSDGVLLDIWINEKGGAVGLSAQRYFLISEKEEIYLQYYLVAGTDEEKLREGIELLCSDVAIKMKATLEALPKN